jgi:cytochrome c-type biogenesis protein CcmH/NrfG
MQAHTHDFGSMQEHCELTVEAISGLRARIRQDPSDMRARVDLARVLLETGETAEAFLHLRIAGERGSHEGEVKYLLGMAHMWADDYSAAVDDLLEAVRLMPGSAPAHAALDAALDAAFDLALTSTAA